MSTATSTLVSQRSEKDREHQVIRVAIIGMGGFAASHHATMLRLEERGESRLIATCDPSPEKFTASIEDWKLAQRGVSVYQDYKEMLERHRHELDAVVIPTPIPLHAEMHKACVEMGLAVYLEKPPTLNHAELESMIEVDQQAKVKTQVGFNFIVEKIRHAMKKRLLAGEFGAIQRIHFLGLWPRPLAYFLRSNWAGRLLLNDALVLDSCMGNAMSHYVHNALFWGGANELYSWSTIDKVQAELYRGHAIQGADTFLLKAKDSRGIEFRMALSHACVGQSINREIIHTELAEIQWVTRDGWEIRWKDGRVERQPIESQSLVDENHIHLYRYIRGELDRPTTRLEDCRPFVTLYNLTFVSAGQIHPVSVERIEEVDRSFVAIPGLEDTFLRFLDTGEFPAAQGCAWGQPEESPWVDKAQLDQLDPVVRSMAQEQAAL